MPGGEGPSQEEQQAKMEEAQAQKQAMLSSLMDHDAKGNWLTFQFSSNAID